MSGSGHRGDCIVAPRNQRLHRCRDGVSVDRDGARVVDADGGEVCVPRVESYWVECVYREVPESFVRRAVLAVRVRRHARWRQHRYRGPTATQRQRWGRRRGAPGGASAEGRSVVGMPVAVHCVWGHEVLADDVR